MYMGAIYMYIDGVYKCYIHACRKPDVGVVFVFNCEVRNDRECC